MSNIYVPVIPAEAGIQIETRNVRLYELDSGLRRKDKNGQEGLA